MAQKIMDEPVLAKSGVAIESIDRWIYNGLGFAPGRFISFINPIWRKRE